MVEVLDQLAVLTKERADSLQRTSRALAGEAEGLMIVANDRGFRKGSTHEYRRLSNSR
jgi:hypothetical protein